MKKLRKVMSFLLAATLLLVNSNSVLAANNQKANDETWEARRAYIEENMIKLGSQGFDNVDEWLQLNGVEKVKLKASSKDKDDVISPMSDPGNISIYSIDGYFDSLAKKYLVKGWWSWNSTSYVDSTTGALEGVALSMSNTDFSPATGYVLASNPAGIAVYDQAGNYYSNTGATSKIDSSGVSYIYQDAWLGTQYRGYKGQAWFWMTTPPTTSSSNPIYLKMHYIHTWTGANLETFGLKWQPGAPPELNMTFSTVPAQWPATNQITIYNWPYN
ncbi:hypothetical protein [Desulfitobacterium sp.]|uniref:hypothetical protein n=1 Tax=Desulfitobacterium sp. TaxID=49981 RepID=UPI002C8163AF|nr:hypothetical protein [Desulfitobacterium sp.]HVJ47733.1 hypothetical protein [Desulfitobacterium sp.]